MTDFDSLVSNIQGTHLTLQESAAKAINRHLTIRNWLIGFDIVEFEQNGEDRAKYGERLLSRLSKLSYTHLVQLFPFESAEKRCFYEVECIKSNWSVSELKRQINTLYYERSGISNNPAALSQTVEENAQRPSIADIIKSLFTFEFLGLKAKDVVYENDLEQALVDNLEAFLIELGHGFCLEAKQKRITMGDEYFFCRPRILPPHPEMPCADRVENQ